MKYSGPRIITPDSLNDADRKVPAALVLPVGKFFFGFKYTPFDPTIVVPKRGVEAETAPRTFSGEGTTLKRRTPGSLAASTDGREATPAPTPVTEEREEKPDPWAKLGGGNTLSNRGVKKAPASTPQSAEVIDATMLDSDDFFGEGEGGEAGEYDDVIEIDSD